MKPSVPQESTGELVDPGLIKAVPAVEGFKRWTLLKGPRRFPAFDAAALDLLTPNAILVEALDTVGFEGDYEYRSVGHALQYGFNENFAGRRLSAIIAEIPKLGLGLKMLYDMIRASGSPLAYRGWVGKDMGGAEFAYYESIILPLGVRDTVTHVLVYSALVPRVSVPGVDAP